MPTTFSWVRAISKTNSSPRADSIRHWKPEPGEAGPRDCLYVLLSKHRVRGVDPDEDRLFVLGAEHLDDRCAGLLLAVRGDGVFEVQDHGVGFGGEGFLDPAWVAAWHVEVAPDG